jgi:hypothetical protein
MEITIMKKKKMKKYLYIIAFGIIILTMIMTAITVNVFHMDWFDKKFILFRVLSSVSMSLIFILWSDWLLRTSIKDDEIILQKEYIKGQRIIYAITFLLCLLDTIRIEMLSPGRVELGANIVIAGAIAQYVNYSLRKKHSLQKRLLILFFSFISIGIFMFGPLYEWITGIHL